MQLHILSAIKNYNKKCPVRFHMPGHKGSKKFCKLFKGADLDVTELSSIDNENALSLARDDVAVVMGANQSWFLTDGSSSGVRIMVYALKNKGNKLIIERGSHKSVYSSLEIFGIEPIIIDDYSGDDEKFSAQIKNAISDDCIGALLTYPNYYGKTFDIKGVAEVLRDKNKYLLIDGAHGGHLRFIDDVIYAGEYADVWVDGLHKTFPTLNQGAVLYTSNASLVQRIDDGLEKMLTTSPSYPLLASIEYGIKYFNENQSQIKSGLNNVKSFIDFAKEVGVNAVQYEDPFKIYLPLKCQGISAIDAERILEKDNIFFEMNDGDGILLMTSPFNGKKDYKKLKNAIKKIATLKRQNFDVVDVSDEKPERVIPYLQATKSKGEWVEIENSVGRILKKNFGNFPPCKPIIVAGEKISSKAIKMLNLNSCFGVKDGKILVVKEDK